METTVIIVPSQAERDCSAQAAVARHDALDPIATPPAFLPCCGRQPDYRKGGAMLASATCPVCQAHYGVWSLNDGLVRQGWNAAARKKQFSQVEIDGFQLVQSLQLTIGHHDRYYNEILVKKEPGKITFRHPDRTAPFGFVNLTSGMYVSSVAPNVYVTDAVPIWAESLPPNTVSIFLHAKSAKWQTLIEQLATYIDEASNGH